ncbi:hypothetical protein BOTBODRAFT_40198 [Botryobasidium botryosum FD-172 SS1]|uniref:Uncharacterized protein n=1 Tax=Botryobasidium botryosum (strain FD-172 SS1) TaxID=930990 RepID=A0A067N0M5_BOTB1|nr:hypothetical protein BOTBODRAFT_40198 [Botryobasidium botryosum FD-172 SS1]
MFSLHTAFSSAQRCLIHTYAWFSTSAYANQLEMKAYIESKVGDFCKVTGLDANGMEIAEIRSTCHAGGYDPNKPPHVMIYVKRGDGTYILQPHPTIAGRSQYSNQDWLTRKVRDG